MATLRNNNQSQRTHLSPTYRHYTKRDVILAVDTIHFCFGEQILAVRTWSQRFDRIPDVTVFAALRRLPYHRFDFLRVFGVDVFAILGVHQHRSVLEGGVFEAGPVTLDDC